jgi:pilus assembly protein CpaC
MKMQFSSIRNGVWAIACGASCAAPALAAPPDTAPQPVYQPAPTRAAAPRPAAAIPLAPPVVTQDTLEVSAGKGTLVRLSENATSVFVADPGVADVHVPSPKAVFVLGKKAGTTTLYVLGANNKTLL